MHSILFGLNRPPHTTDAVTKAGVAFAVAGYGWWAVVTPLYFYMLKDVHALEQLAWRVLAGVPTMVLFLWVVRRLREVQTALTTPSVLGGLSISAVLIGTNWFVFLWAVLTDRLSDASLGYYISPLVAVLLGMVVLGERLRKVQWFAVAVAGIGVTCMAFTLGTLPWISLALAGTFGFYGLTRKRVQVAPAPGLLVEMLLLFPFMVGGLLLIPEETGMSAFGRSNLITALLVFGGVQTMVPLVLFAAGAKRLPLSMLGVLQYISPTGQLLLATLGFGEPFGIGQAIAFCIIWIAVALYTFDTVRYARKQRGFAVQLAE